MNTQYRQIWPFSSIVGNRVENYYFTRKRKTLIYEITVSLIVGIKTKKAKSAENLCTVSSCVYSKSIQFERFMHVF